MGLVGYAIVKRAAMPERRPSADRAPAASLPPIAGKAYGPAEIPLPSGARILRSEASGGRLVVTLELAGGGERVLVVDLATGAVTGTIDLKPQP